MTVPQTLQWEPSVKPVSVQVGSFAGSVTTVCPVALVVTSWSFVYVLPSITTVAVYFVLPVAVQVGELITAEVMVTSVIVLSPYVTVHSESSHVNLGVVFPVRVSDALFQKLVQNLFFKSSRADLKVLPSSNPAECAMIACFNLVTMENAL